MLKKLRGALVVGATVAAGLGLASTAAAGEAEVEGTEPAGGLYPDDPNDSLVNKIIGNINVANESCWAPWHWDGPGNAARTGFNTDYLACENPVQNQYPDGINVLNNSCVAPWMWEGPLNLANTGDNIVYRACNQTG